MVVFLEYNGGQSGSSFVLSGFIQSISENISTVLVDLPSPPERACVQYLEGSVLKATGFQSTLYACVQHSKNRR